MPTLTLTSHLGQNVGLWAGEVGSFPETIILGSRKRGPDPAFPLCFHKNPASRTSVITIPNIPFFPIPHLVPKFWRITLPGSRQIPYPVNVSRIPHCVLVKSRSPGKPFQILLCSKRPCYVNATVLARSTHRGYFS